MTRKYKLLHGDHICNNAEGREVIYRPGSIIETEEDLAGRFNYKGMTPKFELIDDHTEVSDENAKLRERIAELEAQLAQ